MLLALYLNGLLTRLQQGLESEVWINDWICNLLWFWTLVRRRYLVFVGMRLTVLRRFIPSFLRMLIGLGLREVELWIVCFLIRLVYRIWNLESTTWIRHLLELLFVKRSWSFLFFRYLLDFGQLIFWSIFLAALTRAASALLRSSFRLTWTALTWLTNLLFFIWV